MNLKLKLEPAAAADAFSGSLEVNILSKAIYYAAGSVQKRKWIKPKGPHFSILPPPAESPPEVGQHPELRGTGPCNLSDTNPIESVVT